MIVYRRLRIAIAYCDVMGFSHCGQFVQAKPQKLRKSVLCGQYNVMLDNVLQQAGMNKGWIRDMRGCHSLKSLRGYE